MNNILFKGYKVISLSLKTEQPDLNDNVSVNFQALFSQESEKDFMVLFDIKLSTKDGSLINLEYAGFFEADQLITQEFMQSDFPIVNAPAITYPYVRSFISTLTVNAGMQAIILPTVNFKEIVNHNEKTDQAELPLINQ